MTQSTVKKNKTWLKLDLGEKSSVSNSYGPWTIGLDENYILLYFD